MNDNVYKTNFIAWFNYHYIHDVHGYFGGSCENKKKKVFFDFTLTPSHIPWEVPVYRYFKCEGKCEGYSIAFSSFSTYSLTSIPNSFLKHCEKYRGVEKPTR